MNDEISITRRDVKRGDFGLRGGTDEDWDRSDLLDV